MHATLPISTIINFAILVVVLILALRKPLSATMAQKKTTMEKAVQEAEELRATVEKMVTEYRAKISQLDREIAEILAEARAEGEKERARILERARLMAEKIREDALSASERELELWKRKLKREAGEMAVAEALAMLRTTVSEKDHQLFLNQFLSKLSEGNGHGRN